MTTQLPPPSATGGPPGTSTLSEPTLPSPAGAATLPAPPNPAPPSPSTSPGAPTLPKVSGPASPAIVPHTETLPRPWETVPVSDHEQRPAGVPGAPPTRSRRSARYGQPISPLGRGVATLCAIAVNVCAVSWWALGVWERRNLAVDLDEGVAVGQTALVAADDRVASAGLAMVVAGAVTGIALMIWMYRAYRNVGAWRPIDYGVGWSVVGWFVPFLNLVRPAKIMVEIVEGSPTTGRGGGLVWWWWFAWLLPAFGVGLLGLVDTSTPAEYVFHETLVLVTAVVVAIDAVMLMVIVGRATNDQRRRIASDAETEAQLADSR